MKRVVDKHYFAYSNYTTTSGIHVKCPKCSQLGIVTIDNNAAYFKCTSCCNSTSKARTVYHYSVHNQCKECGQYYKVNITDKNQQHFRMLFVTCPYCGYIMSGEVHKTAKAFNYTGDIKNAIEPFFGLELWFSTSFGNRPV